MRPCRAAPYSEVHVVGVIFGGPGKLAVKRSSRLANSVHSWASAGTGLNRTTAARMIRSARMCSSSRTESGPGAGLFEGDDAGPGAVAHHGPVARRAVAPVQQGI